MAAGKGGIECQVKHIFLVLLLIFAIILGIGLAIHFGSQEEAEGTEDTVVIGNHVAPSRPRREAADEEKIFDSYWSTYSAEDKSVPNSTDITFSTPTTTLHDWDMSSQVFRWIVSSILVCLLITVVFFGFLLCNHHKQINRMRRQRKVTSPSTWTLNEGFIYKPLRTHDYKESRFDHTSATVMHTRKLMRNRLMGLPKTGGVLGEGSELKELDSGEPAVESSTCIESVPLIQDTNKPVEDKDGTRRRPQSEYGERREQPFEESGADKVGLRHILTEEARMTQSEGILHPRGPGLHLALAPALHPRGPGLHLALAPALHPLEPGLHPVLAPADEVQLEEQDRGELGHQNLEELDRLVLEQDAGHREEGLGEGKLGPRSEFAQNRRVQSFSYSSRP